MVKNPELRAAVEAWVEANPGKVCEKEDRAGLLRVCEKEMGDHSPKQRAERLKAELVLARSGGREARVKCTAAFNAGRAAFGQLKVDNACLRAKWNPIRNPINNLKRKVAREDLGFRSLEVYTGRRQNCGWVEDAIQAAMQKLVPLGVRFWRHPPRAASGWRRKATSSSRLLSRRRWTRTKGQVVELTLNGHKVVVVQ
jgi:hypothetical protein